MSAYTWVRKALDVARLPRVKLNNIQDLPGAKKKAVRVGRGPGSGRGKTCGRGHKGQGQRNKSAIRVGFEGGQTPFYIRVPKRGFRNKNQVRYVPLNLNRLQYFIDSGRLDTSQPINMHTLQQSGVVGKIEHGVKLLATGSEWFAAKVDIEVSQASNSAIEAIERQGGRIITSHYTPLGLRVLLKPWKFEDREKPRRALPDKKLMAYYLNPENRGYLALTEEGRNRLEEGGMKGAYLGEDGRVHIPGKRVTLYSKPSPPQPGSTEQDLTTHSKESHTHSEESHTSSDSSTPV